MESCNTGNGGGRNGFRGIGNEFPPRGRRGAVWVEKKEIPVYFLFTRIYDYEKISRNSGSSAEYDHVIHHNTHVKQCFLMYVTIGQSVPFPFHLL